MRFAASLHSKATASLRRNCPTVTIGGSSGGRRTTMMTVMMMRTMRKTSGADTRRTATTRTIQSSLVRPFSSVSSSEVEKFNSLHSEWWDSKKNPLIHLNVVRVQYIREQVRLHNNSMNSHSNQQEKGESSLSNDYNKNEDVLTYNRCFHGLKMLDVGCGGGVLSESLARLGAEEVTGIDPSHDLVQAAKYRAQTLFNTTTTEQKPTTTATVRTSPEYHVATAEEWSQQRPHYYDVVCLMDVLEHISNVESLLAAISTLTKPGGLLFISTLNRTVQSYLLSILGAEYIMGYVPMGTHDWNKYQSPPNVQILLEPHGFQSLHEESGMVLRKPPLFQLWDWQLDPRDTNVNWIGAYQKITTPPPSNHHPQPPEDIK